MQEKQESLDLSKEKGDQILYDLLMIFGTNITNSLQRKINYFKLQMKSGVPGLLYFVFLVKKQVLMFFSNGLIIITQHTK